MERLLSRAGMRAAINLVRICTEKGVQQATNSHPNSWSSPQENNRYDSREYEQQMADEAHWCSFASIQATSKAMQMVDSSDQLDIDKHGDITNRAGLEREAGHTAEELRDMETVRLRTRLPLSALGGLEAFIPYDVRNPKPADEVLLAADEEFVASLGRELDKKGLRAPFCGLGLLLRASVFGSKIDTAHPLAQRTAGLDDKSAEELQDLIKQAWEWQEAQSSSQG